jgi:hypothetical protein
MRLRDGDLTDEQLAGLPDDELEAWSEAHAIGSWEANDADPLPPPTEAITIRVPRDLLTELRIEATVRRQPWPRYARDLLLFAVRQVQAARAPRQEAPRRSDDGPRSHEEHEGSRRIQT